MGLYNTYKTVAAGQTAAVLANNGKTGDVIEKLIIVPATTSPGAVTLTDGDGSAFTVFPGGASSVEDLKPITVILGAVCRNATTPGWKATTGADVSIIAVGKFS